jgi:hypothetical protein
MRNPHLDLAEMAAAAAALPFTRLIHFTPARNLSHILRDGQLRSSKDLADNVPTVFSPTDLERYDGHPDHLCCSFEYPNAFYRHVAQRKGQFINYPDWIHVILDRDLVLRPGALFSGSNAATGGGSYLRAGADALRDLWASASVPRGLIRRATHLPAAPSDLQAEVLVPGPVPLSAVLGIIVASESVAREQYGILRRVHMNPDQLAWKVAPVLYNKQELTTHIHLGRTPIETPWIPTAADRA